MMTFLRRSLAPICMLGIALDAAWAGSFDLSIYLGGGGSTGITSYTIANTSSGATPALTSFSIADFYSSSLPNFASLPNGWSGTALSTGFYFYTIVFSADSADDYIQPGSSLDGFTVYCTKPDGAPSFNIVNVPATGYFGDGTQQVDPLAGAMRSVIPEPSTFLLVGLSLAGLLTVARFCGKSHTTK